MRDDEYGVADLEHGIQIVRRILTDLGYPQPQNGVALDATALRIAGLIRGAYAAGMNDAGSWAAQKSHEEAGPAGQRTDRSLARSNALADFAGELTGAASVIKRFGIKPVPVSHHPENAG